MTDDDKIHVLSEALREIIAKADKAWMPVRCFRSEEQAELDDAKHEAWEAAADIAKAALAEVSP